jgi:multidrug transporter EmrE-like cation transporter
MDHKAYALLLVAIVIGVTGQLLLKQGMSRHPAFRFCDLPASVRDVYVLAGFCCYGLDTLLYFTVLRSLDLSVAYPTVSIGYVLVILMSRACFKEQINRSRWFAVLTICVGVALVGFASSL